MQWQWSYYMEYPVSGLEVSLNVKAKGIEIT